MKKLTKAGAFSLIFYILFTLQQGHWILFPDERRLEVACEKFYGKPSWKNLPVRGTTASAIPVKGFSRNRLHSVSYQLPAAQKPCRPKCPE
jgi:hypothetical protein